jgi:hypothetical protein
MSIEYSSGRVSQKVREAMEGGGSMKHIIAKYVIGVEEGAA